MLGPIHTPDRWVPRFLLRKAIAPLSYRYLVNDLPLTPAYLPLRSPCGRPVGCGRSIGPLRRTDHGSVTLDKKPEALASRSFTSVAHRDSCPSQAAGRATRHCCPEPFHVGVFPSHSAATRSICRKWTLIPATLSVTAPRRTSFPLARRRNAPSPHTRPARRDARGMLRYPDPCVRRYAP